MPLKPFDWSSPITGGTAQPEFINWQGAPGMADVSMVDEWLSPLIQAKAQSDLNRFGYTERLGKFQGDEQNRLAEKVQTERLLSEMRARAGLGAEEMGMDLDVGDPMSPEAQAARTRYDMGRMRSQDELSDTYKGMQSENLQSQMRKREQDEAFRRDKMEADNELRTRQQDIQAKLADGRLNQAQARLELDRAFKAHAMRSMSVRDQVAQESLGLRRQRFQFDVHKYNNPSLGAGAQMALADLSTVKDLAEELRDKHEGIYTGGLGTGATMQWANRELGLGGREAGDFYATQSKVRDRIINALAGANVPQQEMHRVLQGLPTSEVADEVWQARLDATLDEAGKLIAYYGAPRGPSAQYNPGGGSASDVTPSRGGRRLVNSPQELYDIPEGTPIRRSDGRTGVVMPGGKVKWDDAR